MGPDSCTLRYRCKAEVGAERSEGGEGRFPDPHASTGARESHAEAILGQGARGRQTGEVTMRRTNVRLRLALVAALAALAALVPASSASAVELDGAWAPFNRCPVHDPVMLAAIPDREACIAANSPNGSIKIGNMPETETGNSNLQFGAACTTIECTDINAATIVPGTGGSVLSDPVQVPGGLLGIIVPEDVPEPLRVPVQQAIDNGPLGVTATVENAGVPFEFDLFAGLALDQQLIALPVKIHLENVVLGPDCFIGSDQNPIVLRPVNTDISNLELSGVAAELDGTVPGDDLIVLTTTGTVQGDDSFAVPEASGCGPAGLLDGPINSRVGLPSPSGNNNLVLNDVTSSAIAGLSGVTGAEFAAGWDSAVLP